MKKINYILIAVAALCLVTACNKKKQTREEQIEEFRSMLTASDTTQMLQICDNAMELLKGLGKLARKYEVGMQTHLVESRWEKAESMRLYGECGTDTGIYKEAGLLDNGPVAGAHFIFPDEEDIRILKECGGFTGVTVELSIITR